ncbi:dihydroxyacetone kinase subunit DhaK [Mycolicibacterium duvalii]|uniref:Dihydroxyacetone kinase family protein n=1 Tax=Mycolicibacterium duvalii TaxID=39688 RepID=A0A7I7K379_9MYCO|nr:dihydroxyacetone kinase family protein [Mycolicibacterium duvalii]MCV7366962.1 dihydroxyacetone kinase family protein [Mycolicibacterium duvalii]PEG36881.1 dihydroxyacetone kinase subunit DhaK [Mycolicibacterium duvalii]BBX17929.1 dihydroxyacetone kinase family protein [Mycolicibacterium duvalii]
MEHRYFFNSVDSFLTDALRGFVAANPGITWHRDPGFLARETPTPAGRVALVSGGGSGHEPMHSGLLGDGLLDAVCPGLIFTSPNALQIAAATRHVHSDAGVLHIVKNYTGDMMNFRIARDMVGDDGIETDYVVVADDVATESDDDAPGRRGTGATIVVEKICGAAAAQGATLAEVAALGRRVADNARSMSVALTPCTVPGSDEPSFDLGGDEMELGVGIHGESGADRTAWRPAGEIVQSLLERINGSLHLASGDDVIVVVNGLGGSHPLELHLLFGHVLDELAALGVRVVRSLVGTMVTAMDMRGASVTVVRADDEMVGQWDAPTDAPAWPRLVAAPPSALSDTTFAAPHDAADSGAECGWLSAFVGRVQDAIDDLTALDRQVGDGDFGVNMSAALQHFSLPLRGSDAEVLDALAQSYFVRAGGTSGAVFGTLFRELSKAFADSDDLTTALAAGTKEALEAIVELGGAQVGDNTVVDALHPANEALQRGDSLRQAAHAATDGAESTKDRVARKGRASYVGEAGKEAIDPGALVVSWLFEAASAG